MQQPNETINGDWRKYILGWDNPNAIWFIPYGLFMDLLCCNGDDQNKNASKSGNATQILALGLDDLMINN